MVHIWAIYGLYMEHICFQFHGEVGGERHLFNIAKKLFLFFCFIQRNSIFGVVTELTLNYCTSLAWPERILTKLFCAIRANVQHGDRWPARMFHTYEWNFLALVGADLAFHGSRRRRQKPWLLTLLLSQLGSRTQDFSRALTRKSPEELSREIGVATRFRRSLTLLVRSSAWGTVRLGGGARMSSSGQALHLAGATC